MKSPRKLLPLLALLALGLGSCHKNCVCTANNGTERIYTAEEVDARGGNCTYLVNQAGTRLYSYCRWE